MEAEHSSESLRREAQSETGYCSKGEMNGDGDPCIGTEIKLRTEMIYGETRSTSNRSTL